MAGLPLTAPSAAPAIGTLDTRAAARARPRGGLRFDLTMMLLSTWFVGGIFLDGWAHNHIAQLETFFTIWHGVLYSGYMATAAFLVGSWWRHRVPGASWTQGLPAGYETSLVGAVLFAFAGVCDMTWHLVFGIEQNIEALLSPTHLLLATGCILMVTGPLRAAWRWAQPARSMLAYLPMLASLIFVFSLCTFFLQFADPLVYPWAAATYVLGAGGDVSEGQALGVAGILLRGLLTAGVVLLAVRRTRLPLGSLTLLFGVNAVLMSFMQDTFRFIPAALAAGLAADLLLHVLRPGVERVLALRTFAFAVPAVAFLPYFLTLQVTGGVGWVIHLWLGSAVMAGIGGLFLSYLLVLPQDAAQPAPAGWEDGA